MALLQRWTFSLREWRISMQMLEHTKIGGRDREVAIYQRSGIRTGETLDLAITHRDLEVKTIGDPREGAQWRKFCREVVGNVLHDLICLIAEL